MNQEILSHGQRFLAHSCRVCGALDGNLKSLTAHELKHELVSQSLAAMRRPGFFNGRGREMTSHGKCLDCDYVGKRTKERCQRCYQRNKARAKRL